MLSSCPYELKVPFARTAPPPSKATANGLPGTPSSRHSSASRTSSKTSIATSGSRWKAAITGFRLWHSRQPSEEKIATARRAWLEAAQPLGQHDPGADGRPFLGELEGRLRREPESKQADLARECQHRHGEHGNAHESRGQCDHEPCPCARGSLGKARDDGERAREDEVPDECRNGHARARAEAAARRSSVPEREREAERGTEAGEEPGRCVRGRVGADRHADREGRLEEGDGRDRRTAERLRDPEGRERVGRLAERAELCSGCERENSG